MIGVTACHLLIIVIEFSSLSLSLSLHSGSLIFTTPLPSNLPFVCIPSFLPFILHPPVYLLLSDARQRQLSHVATQVALSMVAPQAMASTTMTWCVSPATKATPWKDPRQPSARPAASGASSHQHAEVWSSYIAPGELINDWQLG